MNHIKFAALIGGCWSLVSILSLAWLFVVFRFGVIGFFAFIPVVGFILGLFISWVIHNT